MDLLQSLIFPNPPRKDAPPSSSLPDAMWNPFSAAPREPTTHLLPIDDQIHDPATSGLQGVISIEDFERIAAAAAAAAAASTAAAAAATVTAANVANNAAPRPIALGRARSSEHVSRFYLLCQERALVPAFEFQEVKAQLFSVRLSVAGREIEESGPFASKKEAKEAAAEKGCELLLNEASLVREKTSNGEKVENWVGILVEFSQKSATPGPVYQEFGVGIAFACEVTIHQLPNITFGSRDKAFPSKKAARHNAAREAIEWLRQNGYLGAGTGSSPINGSESGSGGESSAGSGSSKGKKRKARSSLGGEESATQQQQQQQQQEKEASWAAQVIAICPILGLSPPEYRFAADPRAPGFHSGAAYFTHNPNIGAGGPVGEVRNIYGKKAAKEECAKGVLQYLRDIAQQRRALAAEVTGLSQQ